MEKFMPPKRIGSLVALLCLAAVITTMLPFYTVSADEGMFMMDKLGSLPLAGKGAKIRATDIYDPVNGGISEAVPRLAAGCSTEFVSADGLILTNHHCAFDMLVAASSPGKDYGADGYRAGSRAEEMPAKDNSIDITVRQEDVTAKVLNGITPGDQAAITKRVAEVQKEAVAKAGQDESVEVTPLSNGLYYYLFVYKTIRDIRVVYAPPKSIGYFGGDPDNFEWTRHCGDFAFLRAYVAPDGKAAEYSANNVPFKPRKFLTISAEGIKENDLMMIVGYPGSTNRYRESYSISFNQNINLPFQVDAGNARIRALEDLMQIDESKALKLQADVFSISNVVKSQDGGVSAMRRSGIVKKRQQDEAKLTQWIEADPARKAKYGEALPKLRETYVEYEKTARKDIIVRELMALNAMQFAAVVATGQVPKDELKAAIPQLAGGEPYVDREFFKFLLRRAAKLPEGQKIAAIEKRFAGLTGVARVMAEDAFARKAIEHEKLTTEKGLNELLELSGEALKTALGPLGELAPELMPEMVAANAHQQALNANVGKYRLPFIKAKAEMNKTTPYPDANFTQRFNYGNVKGYSPKEAVSFSAFTTLDGVFEKDTGRYPFDAPAKLRELWEKKDYGSHAVKGSIPLNFLTTNDIVGGNSGSPVMNANGEQVGIAFDGNYEGLGNDFFVSEELGRTIVVDIRYVLFITEKFGDAGWILKEMNIKRPVAKEVAAL